MSTALCPRCGVDAVLPDVPLYALDADLLREMHEFYFLSPSRKSAAQPAEVQGEGEVQVRVLGPDEAHALNRVAPGVFDGPPRPDATVLFFDSDRHHLAVALADGLVVGMAGGFHYLHPDKAPELFINEVGVGDDWQGRGLGRRLVSALLAHARTLGCESAWTLTETGNLAARRLYLATGGEEQTDVVMSVFDLCAEFDLSPIAPDPLHL
ncbi:MAG: GNAT family N-acetyltransferase [Deinococcus sp.]|uniref:GNAT family N-acetyltransferase n=1 Tax=Deinococcus sp. TaxID=47478 RepID=UPI0026DC5FD0|nr:GNAT family N-acetyltransferase [Deinococcus sp.]MDO4245738.1 GNAT family N-acetyltransferase [Deinococcus sp.]